MKSSPRVHGITVLQKRETHREKTPLLAILNTLPVVASRK